MSFLRYLVRLFLCALLLSLAAGVVHGLLDYRPPWFVLVSEATLIALISADITRPR